MVKSKFDMYYGATPETQEKAKILRKNETMAEKLLWNKLKEKQLYGYKFRRQHPISQFIVDFYCHELKLIIEVDGKIHNKPLVKENDENKPENKEYDDNRTAELERYELKIMRFTNDEIENNLKKVIRSILTVIPSPPGRGI